MFKTGQTCKQITLVSLSACLKTRLSLPLSRVKLRILSNIQAELGPVQLGSLRFPDQGHQSPGKMLCCSRLCELPREMTRTQHQQMFCPLPPRYGGHLEPISHDYGTRNVNYVCMVDGVVCLIETTKTRLCFQLFIVFDGLQRLLERKWWVMQGAVIIYIYTYNMHVISLYIYDMHI